MVFASAPVEETILPSFTSTFIAPQRPAVRILPPFSSAHAGSGAADVTTSAPAAIPLCLINSRLVNVITSSLINEDHCFSVISLALYWKYRVKMSSSFSLMLVRAPIPLAMDGQALTV